MDNVTINLDPIAIRYIVCTVPDAGADEDEDFVPPTDAQQACMEVRSAVNRFYYGE